MDVEACWREMAEAYKEGDTERLQELSEGMLQWLAKDGYPPRICGDREWDKMIAFSVAERFC